MWAPTDALPAISMPGSQSRDAIEAVTERRRRPPPPTDRTSARRMAAEEGLLVGISSGATLAAIAQKLPELPAGAKVLGFAYDTGERYLSDEGFLPNA